jgi:cation:H+ antiporter
LGKNVTNYLLFAGGLALLVVGGDLLVRGASTTAERLGMPPLLIGLTLVGFGTSMPELVTSVEASLLGSPGIAVGNIVGSNIANILLILGISALITPIAVRELALKRDGAVVLVTATAFCGIGSVMPLDRFIGAIFLAALASYIFYAYRQEMAGAPAGHTAVYEKREALEELLDKRAVQAQVVTAGPTATGRTFAVVRIPLAMALGGLIVVILGGKLLVDGATGIARSAGISETVIGLTIVAVGTSLPELVTSVIAALRRHADVALGNVLGSNIYNILGIGGVTALIAPTTIPLEIVRFDNLVMLGVSVLLLIVARTAYRVGRGEGMVLLAGYGAYVFAVWPQ